MLISFSKNNIFSIKENWTPKGDGNLILSKSVFPNFFIYKKKRYSERRQKFFLIGLFYIVINLLKRKLWKGMEYKMFFWLIVKKRDGLYSG